jgi:arginase
METFAERGCMASLEVAEVNPILDHKNRSAAFAVELIASSLGLQII